MEVRVTHLNHGAGTVDDESDMLEKVVTVFFDDGSVRRVRTSLLEERILYLKYNEKEN